MVLNDLLSSAGKLVETAQTATRVKPWADALGSALDELIFGSAPTADPTNNAIPSLAHRGESTNHRAHSTFIHSPSLPQHKVVRAQKDPSATEPRQQKGSDKDAELESEREEEDVHHVAQNTKKNEGNSLSQIRNPIHDAPDDSRYSYIWSRDRKNLHYSPSPVLDPVQNCGEDGLEEYESDSEETSGSASNVVGPTNPTENASKLATIPAVTEDRMPEDQTPGKADIAQAFLDNLFAEKLTDNTLFMSLQHSATLSDLPHHYSSQSLNRPDTTHKIVTPPLNPNSVTSQGCVDRPRRTISLHFGKSPYQLHSPNYMPEPFSPSNIPTTVIGSPNGNILQVQWPTPMIIPNAEALSGSDLATRDVEMSILDQLVERYYWEERAGVVWAENDVQREAIRQVAASIKAMEILSEFAAHHRPNFIIQRLQELDDVLTPQIFQGTSHRPHYNIYLSQVRLPVREEEGSYHQVIQRYRHIYKGYRLFANRYKLPFRDTVLDVDADVDMCGPHD